MKPPSRALRALAPRALALRALAALALFAGAAGCPIYNGPVPVLFVHGMGGDPSDFDAMRAYFEARGYDPALLRALRLSSSQGCIEGSAIEVAREAERLAKDAGAPEADVVGHSLGGLAARYAVKSLGSDLYVRRIVTLATPHHGTSYAQPNPLYCAVTQIALESPFLAALNRGDETPGIVDYTSVLGALDTLIDPPESAALLGADNVSLPFDHLGMLSEPEAFEVVYQALSGDLTSG